MPRLWEAVRLRLGTHAHCEARRYCGRLNLGGCRGAKNPSKTKRALRYLAWASAMSAAWAVGRAVKSRRRSQVSDAQSASRHGEVEAPAKKGKVGERE